MKLLSSTVANLTDQTLLNLLYSLIGQMHFFQNNIDEFRHMIVTCIRVFWLLLFLFVFDFDLAIIS